MTQRYKSITNFHDVRHKELKIKSGIQLNLKIYFIFARVMLIYYYTFTIATVAALVGGYCYYKKSRKKDIGISSVKNEILKEVTGEIEKDEAPAPAYTFRIAHNLAKQSIFLLGEFLVKDKNGDDITNSFTPTLKTLLITLILSSEENPDGISGDDLYCMLWSNKSKYAARNNRNVSFSKLRGLFSQIGNITIVNKQDYWKIVFGTDVLCDYNEIRMNYRAMKENNLNDKNHIDKLIDLLYRGTLLYHTKHESFDKYKGDFTYQTVDILTGLLKREDITDNILKIKITDTILQHDCLNENGLQQKCRLLKEQGELKAIDICYRKFCADHLNLLGVRYTKTLQGILMSPD